MPGSASADWFSSAAAASSPVLLYAQTSCLLFLGAGRVPLPLRRQLSANKCLSRPRRGKRCNCPLVYFVAFVLNRRRCRGTAAMTAWRSLTGWFLERGSGIHRSKTRMLRRALYSLKLYLALRFTLSCRHQAVVPASRCMRRKCLPLLYPAPTHGRIR